MKILITGGSGLVGSILTKNLLHKGHHIRHLTRSVKGLRDVEEFEWDIPNRQADKRAFENLDAVVHLAGEGVAVRKWNVTQKERIISSRIGSAKLLFDSISKSDNRPAVIVSASGVGYYGIDTKKEIMHEENKKGDGFLADVVDLWESSTDQFPQLGIRTVKLRIGVVLSKYGGALPKMILPVKFGLGSPLGKGSQMMSWIHIDDLCKMILYSIENTKINGVYNAVSSNPVTNKEMTRSIAKVLKRPMFMPNVPEFILKLMLGEMSAMVTGGNRVSNRKIKTAGFYFEYENLDDTLGQILNKD